MTMRMTFDPEADAAYLYIEDEKTDSAAVEQVVVEREGRGDIVLDFDEHGRLLGVEIIGAEGLLGAAVLAVADRI